MVIEGSLCLHGRRTRGDFWSAEEEEMEVTDQKPQRGHVTHSVRLHTAAEITEMSLAYTT